MTLMLSIEQTFIAVAWAVPCLSLSSPIAMVQVQWMFFLPLIYIGTIEMIDLDAQFPTAAMVNYRLRLIDWRLMNL